MELTQFSAVARSLLSYQLALPLVRCTWTFVPCVDDQGFGAPTLLLGIRHQLADGFQRFGSLDLAAVSAGRLALVKAEIKAVTTCRFFHGLDFAESLSLCNNLVADIKRLKLKLGLSHS